MEAVTETKQGYKKSTLGWIPEHWIEGRVNDLLTGLESGVSVNGQERALSNGEKGVLKVSAVSYGQFNAKAAKAIESDKELKRAKTHPKKGQIIISRSNTEELVGASAYIERDYNNLFLPDKLWQTIPKPGTDMKWLSYVLSSSHARYTLSNLATGTSGSMKNITKGELLNLKISIPPLSEQQKIAQILSTWDKAIEQTQNLIEQLKKRKKGLMQQLLTGKTRLKGFCGEWKEVKLGKYFTQRNETNHNELQLLSVGINGVYPQDDSVKKDTSNSDKTKYKRICVGDIGYNTMRMWQGRSALSQLEGIVSPAYTIVTPKMNADSLFFSYLFKLDYVVHRFYRYSQGLVSDTWQCRFNDFIKVKVLCPPTIEEQQAIAKVLTTADNEIGTQETYLQQLQDQKKGLMQQLLTGKKRVKIE